MNPPATPDVLEQRLARVLGTALPPQLVDSLLTHDGIDHVQGCWFANCGTLAPYSVEQIEAHWKLDRQYDAEAIAEGDEPRKHPNLIPIIGDLIAENTIYMDAKSGEVSNYVHAGLFFAPFRFGSYNQFLIVVQHHIENDKYFEWPSHLPDCLKSKPF